MCCFFFYRKKRAKHTSDRFSRNIKRVANICTDCSLHILQWTMHTHVQRTMICKRYRQWMQFWKVHLLRIFTHCSGSECNRICIMHLLWFLACAYTCLCESISFSIQFHLISFNKKNSKNCIQLKVRRKIYSEYSFHTVNKENEIKKFKWKLCRTENTMIFFY